MKIAAATVSFDYERGLLRRMNGIHGHFDLMIVIEGKFRCFEDDLNNDQDLLYEEAED